MDVVGNVLGSPRLNKGDRIVDEAGIKYLVSGVQNNGYALKILTRPTKKYSADFKYGQKLLVPFHRGAVYRKV